ncbi:hypothetical protein [Marinimicrobium sp. C2-29]|uniref:hypothetical protein n=1 Tax=Marinimicrobium sp. C2-29 TaxID=3139825 RepID=UPI003138D888
MTQLIIEGFKPERLWRAEAARKELIRNRKYYTDFAERLSALEKEIIDNGGVL